MAVLVMAEAPRGAVKPRLEGMLGREGCARLQRALIARALRWAAEEGDAVYVAYAPEDAEAEVAALAPAGATLFAQRGAHRGERLADAVPRGGGGAPGPGVGVGGRQPGPPAAACGAAAGGAPRPGRGGGDRSAGALGGACGRGGGRPPRRRRHHARAGDGRWLLPARRAALRPGALRDRPGRLGRP